MDLLDTVQRDYLVNSPNDPCFEFDGLGVDRNLCCEDPNELKHRGESKTNSKTNPDGSETETIIVGPKSKNSKHHGHEKLPKTDKRTRQNA
jgi:hypothetical protein